MKIWAMRLPVRFCSSSTSDSCASVTTPASRRSSPRRLVDREGVALEVAMGHPKIGATRVPTRLQWRGGTCLSPIRPPPPRGRVLGRFGAQLLRRPLGGADRPLVHPPRAGPPPCPP